jgi:endoglucanase
MGNRFSESAQDELFRSLMGNFTRWAKNSVRRKMPMPTIVPTFFRIKARANGKFVSAQNSGDGPLAAVRDRVDIWEEFSLVQSPEDGTVSLRARANGKLVAADLNQAGRLVARSETVQQWEKFQMEPKGGGANGNEEGTFALKARANGKFVAVDRGSQVLVSEFLKKRR